MLRTSAFRASQLLGGAIGATTLINGQCQTFPMRTNRIEMTQGSVPFLQMGRIDVPSVFEDAPRCRMSGVYCRVFPT